MIDLVNLLATGIIAFFDNKDKKELQRKIEKNKKERDQALAIANKRTAERDHAIAIANKRTVERDHAIKKAKKSEGLPFSVWWNCLCSLFSNRWLYPYGRYSTLKSYTVLKR